MRTALRSLRGLLPSALLFAASFACGGGTNPTSDAGHKLIPEDLLNATASCAFDCDPSCEQTGYSCDALGDWASLPHATSCGSWDGTTTPTPVVGKCKATAPTGEALKYAGVDPDDRSVFVLPTGQRTKPVGERSIFSDFKGQFPTNVVPVPGSDLVVVVDGGIEQQSVRLVDTTLIGSATDPVVGKQSFVGSEGVNYGAVVVVASSGPARLWVSGSAGSVIYAFDLDIAGKTLKAIASDNIKIDKGASPEAGGGLAGGYYVSGLALAPDRHTLWAATMNGQGGKTPVFAIDVDPTSATYKHIKNSVSVAAKEIFTVGFHPADTTGQFLYASLWDKGAVAVIDTASGAVVASYATGKSPEVFAAIGTRYLAVVDADTDDVSILDTLATGGRKVTSVSLRTADNLEGASPSGAFYQLIDATSGKLFVTLGGLNAIAELDVTIPADGSAPSFSAPNWAGTDWWPTAVTQTALSGSLVILSGKGNGTGAEDPTTGSITAQMRGSIQLATAADLTAAFADSAGFEKRTNPSKQTGLPTIDCGGAPSDFPIPATNTEGPSKSIKHIVFVVKENKTFDAVFGDMPGVAGDPKDVLAPGQMDVIFVNQRAIARTFANFDNYYTSAEQSLQGHIWTAFGRTTEYVERTWLVTWGRAFRSLPTQGLTDATSPREGSLFSWLERNKIDFDDMGELVGNLSSQGVDPRYPGTVYSMDKPDVEKTCYVTGRARGTCDLRSFSYLVTPNDHTAGGSAGLPSPQTYIAVGDESTGLLVDGLSHSPIWPQTLVIVTEDDPQDGGDHIDAHRTPLYMASPWMKRGYVSKTHIDVASVHKIIAHVFGIPYANETVARAVIPFDAFTSSPDYSAFKHIPRKQALACNPKSSKFATEAALSKWDLSKPDEAPGLSRQVWEMVHGTPPPVGYGDGDD